MHDCVQIQWSSWHILHLKCITHFLEEPSIMRDAEGHLRIKRTWTVALHVRSRHYKLSLSASWAKRSPTCRLIYRANIDHSVKTVNLSSMFDAAPFNIQSAALQCMNIKHITACWSKHYKNCEHFFFSILSVVSLSFQSFKVYCHMYSVQLHSYLNASHRLDN